MSEPEKQPTEFGRKKWAPDGYYRPWGNDSECKYACTCTAEREYQDGESFDPAICLACFHSHCDNAWDEEEREIEQRANQEPTE